MKKRPKQTRTEALRTSLFDLAKSTAPEALPVSVLDNDDVKTNIIGLFDLLLRIDKRNHPELYD